jgi:hypothetical protein
MFTSAHNLKVASPVVRFVLIFMMDNSTLTYLTTNLFLGNPFVNRFSTIGKSFISLFVDELEGREFDVARAALVIAKIIGEDVFQNILGLVKERAEEEKVVNLEGNKVFELFKLIFEKLEKSNEEWFSLKVLTEELLPRVDVIKQRRVGSEDIDDEEDKKKKTTKLNRYIARVLRGITLFKKTRSVHGCKEVFFRKIDVENYMKLENFIPDDTVLVQNVENKLPVTTKPTNATNTHPNDQKEVVSGSQDSVGSAQIHSHNIEKSDNYLKSWKESGGEGRSISKVKVDIGKEGYDYYMEMGLLYELSDGKVKPIC